MYYYDTEDEFSTSHVWIDEITNCLVEAQSGKVVDTIVKQISTNELSQCTEETGWYIDWSSWDDDVEIYALYVKNNDNIEGLIALHNNTAFKSADIDWMCAAPHNNYDIVGDDVVYKGVGGHLFAIAVDCSSKWGYNGGCILNAATADLVEHYEQYGCTYAGIRHLYHMVLPAEKGQELTKKYTLVFE